eukprot:4670528-Pleurochrysis_carterae.AAC.1
MRGVHMCDIDLSQRRVLLLSPAQATRAREIIFNIIVKTAVEYDDVVDASSAIALLTPHGMHIYFVTDSRKPSAERLMEFMKQTNDARYITAFALDPDRGFCDKVYQLYSSEVVRPNCMHVHLASDYKSSMFGNLGASEQLAELLELRRAVAEYVISIYSSDNYYEDAYIITALTDSSGLKVSDIDSWQKCVKENIPMIAHT